MRTDLTQLALFAGGNYYPNGGWKDFRGMFNSMRECEERFQSLFPTLMSEQGYSRQSTPSNHVWAQIVDLETRTLVKELRA